MVRAIVLVVVVGLVLPGASNPVKVPHPRPLPPSVPCSLAASVSPA